MVRNADDRSLSDASRKAHREDLTQRARERHDALSDAIERLERALAAPAATRAGSWSERVSTEVGLVQKAIETHVEDIEEPDGLLDEVEFAQPRLSARVAALRQEHHTLAARAQALASRLPADDRVDFQALRRAAAALLGELRSHRALEADLVYEAFWTDLGAVD